MRYFSIIIFSILAGYFLIIYEYLFLAVLTLCISSLYFLLKYRTPTIYCVFFVFLIWCPLWVNSNSLFGIRFGIVSINAPLIFLALFSFKAVTDIYNGESILKLKFTDWIIHFFFFWAFFSLTKTIYPDAKRNFYCFGFPVIYYLTVRFSHIERDNLLRWAKIIIYSSLPMVLYLIFEMITKINIFLPPQHTHQYFSYMYDTPSGYQPGGPFIGPNYTGLFLSMVIALCLYFYNNSFSVREKRKWVFSIIFLTAGVLITLSRSAVASLLVVFLINMLFNYKDKIKKIYIFFTTLIGVGAFFYLFDLPQMASNRLFNKVNIIDRIRYAEDSINIIKEHWFAGIGYENFRFRHLGEISGPTHNLFTSLLVELGIIGLLPFLIIISIVFIKWNRYRGSINTDKHLLTAFISIFSVYFVTGMAHSVNLDFHSSSIFWIFLSIYLNHDYVFNLSKNKNFTN